MDKQTNTNNREKHTNRIRNTNEQTHKQTNRHPQTTAIASRYCCENYQIKGKRDKDIASQLTILQTGGTDNGIISQ